MLGRRLYSGISRGAGAACTSAPPAHHASASSSSSSTTSSASTRGRTKSNRQTVRVRSLYSPPQWVSQLIHGQSSTTSRSLEQGGMALRSVPIESIESLLGSRGIATGASRRGRQRPFSSRRSSTTSQVPEKSMAQLIKEAKPLVQNPLAKDYTFRPVPLYPAAFHAHLAFNPPHLPIPANLGTAIYSQPRRTSSHSASTASSPSNSAEDLFSAPPPPSPLRKLSRAQAKSQTAMTEHMSIISALSHPAHLAALPTGFETLAATPLGMGMGDVEEHLARTLAEAETKNQILAERDFAKAMEVLEGKGKAQQKDEASKQVVEGQEGQVQMDEVLQGVEALLGRLSASAGADAQVDMGMGEDVVEMDSVKRKRKKKISKHKYKKRRKATRAQRKRLGK